MQTVTKLNKEQRLFVFHSGKYFSCLGFDVLEKRFNSLSIELNYTQKSKRSGTLTRYKEYCKLLKIASDKHKQTGWKSKSELIPEFIGNEGKRVEVVTSWGEVNRFIIGKSTGFIPCHLEIKKSNSTGGSSVCGHPFKSIKFLS